MSYRNIIIKIFQFLLIITYLLTPQLLFPSNFNSENKILKEHSKIKKQFSGEYIDYINTAFSNYLKMKGYLNNNDLTSINGNLKYYIFFVYESDDSIVVEIKYNQRLLKKEKNIVIKGGSAKYYIIRNSKKIEKKEFYK